MKGRALRVSCVRDGPNPYCCGVERKEDRTGREVGGPAKPRDRLEGTGKIDRPLSVGKLSRVFRKTNPSRSTHPLPPIQGGRSSFVG